MKRAAFSALIRIVLIIVVLGTCCGFMWAVLSGTTWIAWILGIPVLLVAIGLLWLFLFEQEMRER